LVEVWLPYGLSEIPVRVPEERLIDIFRTRSAGASPDALSEARKLTESNEHLQTLAKKAKRVCIVLGQCGNLGLASDLVKILRQTITGNPQATITILCAREVVELEQTLPPETRIVRHYPATSATLPLDNFKGEITPELNSEFLAADLKIIVGEYKPHPFLTSSGLCDIVFPGVASQNSIKSHLANRKGLSAVDLHKERLEVVNSTGDVIALGVILDSDKTAIYVALGCVVDCLTALEDASQRLLSRDVAKTADIVVMGVGGAPQDESLVQAVETFPVGVTAIKRNGVLIIASECSKGHGGTEFYDWCAEKKEPHHLEARLRHHFNYNGYKAAFLRRLLDSHRVYLVSTLPDYYVENVFGMRAARTVNAALQTVQRTLGSDSTISVIPDASRIILREATPPS
jgi:nickel-dependent lactate racemase